MGMTKKIQTKISNIINREKLKSEYERFCSTYEKEFCYEKSVIEYTASMKIKEIYYKFSNTSDIATIYSSVYACLLNGLYNEWNDEEKNIWKIYFDSHQKENGLFEDKQYDNHKYYHGSNGWGAYHLIPHLTIAYDRIGATPKYEFVYLNNLKEPDAMIKWLKTLDYRKVWGSSNAIMNYGVAMQYARDKMNMPFEKSIDAMEDFLLKNINSKYGMWFDGKINKKAQRYEMIRGLYHILPILYYDHINLPYAERAIEQIIMSQNKWGGFDTYIGSSACDDIDAVDPLLRLSKQLKLNDETILSLLEKAKIWILFNQNQDGGFVFEKGKPFMYGEQKCLSSIANESNMFATWFRSVSLELIESFINKSSSRFMRTPGYECPL